MARSSSEKFLIFFLTIVFLIGVYAGISYLKKTFYDPLHMEDLSIEIADELTSANIIREGDIIFQNKRPTRNDLMSYLNEGEFNHAGIIIMYGNRYHVLEVDDVVGFTPLSEWIARNQRGSFEIKRFKRQNINSNRLLSEGMKYSGKSDDFLYNWSDEQIYNSELVFKVMQHTTGRDVVTPRRIRDINFSSEGEKLLRETYGDNIPRQQPIVTVTDIYKSENLESIYRR